jgi:hypothetical protein
MGGALKRRGRSESGRGRAWIKRREGRGEGEWVSFS